MTEDGGPSSTNQDAVNGELQLEGIWAEGQGISLDEDDVLSDNDTIQSITVESTYVPGESRVILPTDIHPHIIESYSEEGPDTRWIARCALVCRAWLPISRRKLYSCPIRIDRRTWTAFRHFTLHTKSSSMVQCRGMIRDLAAHVLDPGAEDPWTHLLLIEGAMRLTGLVQLTMHAVNWGFLNAMALGCGQCYQSLTDLRLVECTFSNVHQFHQVITAFPSLRDLDLSHPRFHSASTSLHISTAGHPLRSLRLLYCDDNSAMTVLSTYFRAHPRLVQNLQSLSWCCYRDCEPTQEAFTFLIQAVKSTHLEKLKY